MTSSLVALKFQNFPSLHLHWWICFFKLPTYNDAELYPECIAIACRIMITYFLKKKGSNRLIADYFPRSCGFHGLGLRIEALDFNWFRNNRIFLFLTLLFFVLEIVSTFYLYFLLEAIRRWFESQKRNADVEAKSQEEIDAELKK